MGLKIYDRKEISAGESTYQIVRQPKFRTRGILNDRRGDLMLLINGMPVIHVELKRSGIPVSQAYNQIEKYSYEGAFRGIFSLIQIFVAMSPEETVYFANPSGTGFNKSFYFHWADFDNLPINDWKRVVSELLNIPMAHRLVGFYTIPDKKDNTLKVLRSYQYYAASKIAAKVAKRNWAYGGNAILGGYVWHTTGSGKTLTSYKSAQLISGWKDADKVIFLVDRKALNVQAFDDYKGFGSQGDSIQDTATTNELVSALRSTKPEDILIITSIQKLSNVAKEAMNLKALEKILDKRIVIIIDEAHRSTFGTMLAAIKRTFSNALFFGFTGTPIQDANSKKDNTTATIFGDELHRYTLADGIRDKNVLGFDPYMVRTYDDSELRKQVALHEAKAKSVEEALNDEKKSNVYNYFMNRGEVEMAGRKLKDGSYIKGIEDYIPKSQYTNNPKHMEAVVKDIKKEWLRLSYNGLFHAILATSSIPEAVRYYRLLKSEIPELNITAVFDPNIDNDDDDGQKRYLDKEDGIVEILTDYNTKFSKCYDMASYDLFRVDVQMRIAHRKSYINVKKEQQLNIMIVVNQMLTGFDSKWINTLYMDKVMEYENLIQAFSRTNRLFGAKKPFGVIRYYRRPNTMARNIREAVELYSGSIPTGLFVDKLPKNLERLNGTFNEIRELFGCADIKGFEKLPDDTEAKMKFAKLFKQFNSTLESAKIQGFDWNKSTYVDDATKMQIDINFNRDEYLALLQRYRELFPVGTSHASVDLPYDIDTNITETSMDIIDSDYMDLHFRKFLRMRNDPSNDPENEVFGKVIKDFHKSFAMLNQEEQHCAELFLGDILSGTVHVENNGKKFIDYVYEYKRRNENSRISRVAESLGCDENLLRKIMGKHVTEQNINAHNFFTDLCKSVDIGKATQFFQKENGDDCTKIYKVRSRVHTYLKNFILSDGKNI